VVAGACSEDSAGVGARDPAGLLSGRRGDGVGDGLGELVGVGVGAGAVAAVGTPAELGGGWASADVRTVGDGDVLRVGVGVGVGRWLGERVGFGAGLVALPRMTRRVLIVAAPCTVQ
jgi:hypothetical protein